MDYRTDDKANNGKKNQKAFCQFMCMKYITDVFQCAKKRGIK